MVGRSQAFGELVEEIQEELQDVDLSAFEPKDEDLVPADSTDLG